MKENYGAPVTNIRLKKACIQFLSLYYVLGMYSSTASCENMFFMTKRGVIAAKRCE